MTTWREQLGKVEFQDGRKLIGATYRGVPFYVDSSELTGGRRTVTHEYPLRDRPFVEDMGRRSRKYPVEGYVLGDSYLTRRNALIDALELGGAAELVHPSYGTLMVICSDFRVRERTDDGGLARFQIDFEETEGSPAFPVEGFDAEAVVASSADKAWAAEREALIARYHVAGAPASALTSLTAVVTSATEALDVALAPYVEGVQELAKLKLDLYNLGLEAGGLVRRPLDLLTSLEGLYASVAELPLAPLVGAQVLLAAYGFTPSVARPPSTTPTRALEQANYDALLRLTRTLPAVQAASRAPTEAYDTYDAAVALRDSIGSALDELADTADDSAYAALVQLRADLVRAVPGEATDLPRLVQYTPPYTVPSLVLAQSLYGDVAREADIVARNRVNRPGFVQGGVQLEVLSA